jgi:hypothetical protein
MRAHQLDPHRADVPIKAARGIDEETMSERFAPEGSSGAPMLYEIRLAGHLDPRWAAWFDGLAVTTHADGSTVISGPIPDQAALHGVLQRVRDLGLTLMSVNQPEDDPARGRGSG